MQPFRKEYLVKMNRAANEKFKVVKKALDNTEGILMGDTKANRSDFCSSWLGHMQSK